MSQNKSDIRYQFTEWVKLLVSPLLFIQVQHKSKRTLQVSIPLCICSFIWSFVVLFANANFFGDSGVIKSLMELFEILIGFYIASLAAISAFSSSVLDTNLDGESFRLPDDSENLSRRQLLSLAFGYLSFSTLVLYLLGMLLNLIDFNWRLQIIIGFLYMFWVSHLIVTTLFTLHYLSIKIHQPNYKPKSKD